MYDSVYASSNSHGVVLVWLQPGAHVSVSVGKKRQWYRLLRRISASPMIGLPQRTRARMRTLLEQARWQHFRLSATKLQ